MLNVVVAAQTVVQIIGLAVVTAGGTGIDIVMPRIQSPPGATHTTGHASARIATSRPAIEAASQTIVPAPEAVVPAPQAGAATALMVEGHTAIVAFRTEDVLTPTTGWNVQELSAVSGYSYVALNGEHLRFIVNGVNPVATVPAGLPRLSHGCIDKSTSRLAVRRAGRPGLAQANTAVMNPTYHPVLNAGYRPPAYSQASAVLKVPVGATSACSASVNGKQNGRVDTRIVLVNDGTVVLEATKGNAPPRTLSFTSVNDATGEDTLLIVANVPNSFLAPGLGAKAIDAGHFQAYYSMLDAAAETNCTRQPLPAGIPTCNVNMAMRVPGNSPSLPPGPIVPPVPPAMYTYECSNSQYP